MEKPSLPFNASLDPSNPLGLLEKVLDFIGKESDFLLKDTAEKEIATAVTAVKKSLREAKKEEKESVKPLEKNLKEESVPIEVEKLNKESLEPTEPMDVEKLNKESLRPTETMDLEKPKEEKIKLGTDSNKVNVLPGEVPNKGNGLDFEKYSWTQNPQEVTITIPVPSGTNPRYVTCKFEKSRLKVGLSEQHTILDGSLFGAVKPDDCFWITVDEKVIWVILTKQDRECWKYCMKGEPEIDTKKVKPWSSKLDDLDPETRSRVEEMMFDQRQKLDLRKKAMSQRLSRMGMKDRMFRRNLMSKRK